MLHLVYAKKRMGWKEGIKFETPKAMLHFNFKQENVYLLQRKIYYIFFLLDTIVSNPLTFLNTCTSKMIHYSPGLK
jgi:hypothetical protein